MVGGCYIYRENDPLNSSSSQSTVTTLCYSMYISFSIEDPKDVSFSMPCKLLELNLKVIFPSELLGDLVLL